MARGRSSRTDAGIWSNRPSREFRPMASSIRRTSSSVWGANRIPKRSLDVRGAPPPECLPETRAPLGVGGLRPRIPRKRCAFGASHVQIVRAVRFADSRSAGQVLQAVLADQAQVVALVEDLAVDLGVQLA